jgi:hypothetical protein
VTLLIPYFSVRSVIRTESQTEGINAYRPYIVRSAYKQPHTPRRTHWRTLTRTLSAGIARINSSMLERLGGFIIILQRLESFQNGRESPNPHGNPRSLFPRLQVYRRTNAGPLKTERTTHITIHPHTLLSVVVLGVSVVT